MAALHTPLSSLDEWWKADICTVMQEVKNQVSTNLNRKGKVSGGYGIYIVCLIVSHLSIS